MFYLVFQTLKNFPLGKFLLKITYLQESYFSNVNLQQINWIRKAIINPSLQNFAKRMKLSKYFVYPKYLVIQKIFCTTTKDKDILLHTMHMEKKLLNEDLTMH
jgi:hypothetical protein